MDPDPDPDPATQRSTEDLQPCFMLFHLLTDLKVFVEEFHFNSNSKRTRTWK
jgi:hypothetical protein